MEFANFALGHAINGACKYYSKELCRICYDGLWVPFKSYLIFLALMAKVAVHIVSANCDLNSVPTLRLG